MSTVSKRVYTFALRFELRLKLRLNYAQKCDESCCTTLKEWISELCVLVAGNLVGKMGVSGKVLACLPDALLSNFQLHESQARAIFFVVSCDVPFVRNRTSFINFWAAFARSAAAIERACARWEV